MKKSILLMLILLNYSVLIASNKPLSKAIIFDCSDTLFTQNKNAWLKAIGNDSIAEGIYLFARLFAEAPLREKMNLSGLVKKSLFEVLNSHTSKKILEKNELYVPRDPTGGPVPFLLTQWWKGEYTSFEMLEHSKYLLKNYSGRLGRMSGFHREIIERAFSIMFSPSRYAQTLIPIEAAANFLKLCKAASTKKNSSIENLYLLTNFDAETFQQLATVASHSVIFDHIRPEHRYVSAIERQLKPYPSIYQDFMIKHNLLPEQCILIDDQEENCKAARNEGWIAIHINKSEGFERAYKRAHAELITLQILQDFEMSEL